MVYIGIAVAEQVVHEQDAQIRAVDSIAALKALPVAARYGLVRTHGYYSALDGGGDLWRWNATSTVAESDTVVRPDDLTATDPGRWERFELIAVPVEAFGMGTAKSAATNRAAFLRAVAEPGVHLVFGAAGDYLYDNSTLTTITGFEGRLTFNPKARLVFTDNTQGGLVFIGGTGPVFENPHLTYTTLPTVRQNDHAIRINSVTDPLLINLRVNGAPQFGCLFQECNRPKAVKTRILNTKADGMHFAMCQDVMVQGHYAENTGDDGLAISGDPGYPYYQRAQVSNVIIRGTDARGIAVIGQSDVVVQGFYVENTKEPGLIVFQDVGYNTRAPDNVRIANGHVKNGGARDPANLRFGINVQLASNVEFDNITVDSPGTRGMDAKSMSGRLTVRNVHIKNVSGDNSAFDLVAPVIFMSDLIAEEVGSYGFVVQDCPMLFFNNLTAINCSKVSTLRRAMGFAGPNVASRMQGSGLHIIDTQATPTGYILHTWNGGAGITGHLGDIDYIIPNGNFVMDNQANLPIGSINGVDTHEVSPNRGDADFTIPAKETAPIQRFDTTLTANRTVTLPTAGNYNGRWFKIVRRGLGAFTLNVGGLKTIPASTAAAVEVTHDGSAWDLTGYEVL